MEEKSQDVGDGVKERGISVKTRESLPDVLLFPDGSDIVCFIGKQKPGGFM